MILTNRMLELLDFLVWMRKFIPDQLSQRVKFKNKTLLLQGYQEDLLYEEG
jgi:hypothetical protein